MSPNDTSISGNVNGSVALFTCGAGYGVNGSSSLTCGVNIDTLQGVWDGSVPTCERECCLNHGFELFEYRTCTCVHMFTVQLYCLFVLVFSQRH